MNNNEFFFDLRNDQVPSVARPLPASAHGKIYADVPLNFFASIDELKNYVIKLKALGVNVLLILPHFLPSFSAYVVRNFEKPCELFGTWEAFTEFMLFVKQQGLDRMIDIPLNHADWQAEHLNRQWFKDPENNGIEAGADDEDADGNRVRVNWGAYILDNANPELQDYWLEKVIYPHLEKMHVNAIRIDAAWGLDPQGLTRLVGETKKRFNHVWFLAENLGMSKLIKLAESGIAAGADRFFNNMYWYSGGLYIPTDIYTLYKRSGGLPTCTIYSSHDTLMPAMKSYARLRSSDVKGLNDKAVVGKFVEQEKIVSLTQLDAETLRQTLMQMKLDFALAALMSSDVMLAAGSELGLFERIDVRRSGPAEFARGISSDLPEFMATVLKIKSCYEITNCEGVVIPFGAWQSGQSGIRGYVKTDKTGNNLLVAVNNGTSPQRLRIPNRMKRAKNTFLILPGGKIKIAVLPTHYELEPGKIIILIDKK